MTKIDHSFMGLWLALIWTVFWFVTGLAIGAQVPELLR